MSSNSKKESDIKPPSLRSRWLWGSLFTLLAILILLALADYHPDQWRENATTRGQQNIVGLFGAAAAYYLNLSLGGVAWIGAAFLAWMAWLHFSKSRRNKWGVLAAMIGAVVGCAGLLAMQTSAFVDAAIYHGGPGGSIGNALYHNLMKAYVGPAGTALILGLLSTICYFLVFAHDDPNKESALFQTLKTWWQERSARNAELKEAKLLAKQQLREERARLKAEKLAAKQEAASDLEAAKQLVREGKKATSRAKLAPEIDPEPEPDALPVRSRRGAKAALPAPAAPTPEPVVEEKKPALKDVLKFIAPEETKKARVKLPVSSGDYIFPTLDLLKDPAKPHSTNSEEEHRLNAERLQQTLKEFNVEVTLGDIHIGPVITRYEVYPAPGVRVERIANLDKNIALGMRAQSVRILAPVPGKGCVGIEVPNQNSTPVGIREILESEDWAKANCEIPIALGRDVSGKPMISDLTKMPHLLIAGATGSGKTVCINSIITSLLYHSSPENLRFIMVDPKIVEMKVFNALPHMLIPVVTDPKKVPGALKWLLNEMEHRYETFAKVGVRNIAGYNGRKKPEKKKTPAELEAAGLDQPELNISVPRDEGVFDEPPEKYPYIVAIVDELADLMMVAPADVETGIARLAQLARAAGIHLVIATQRPSVNVITGVIKANLPCRIAFQVASKIDSRTILDGSGAEQLIGRGDMLFSPPGTSKLIRSQGAFVSDEEIHDIVEFLKTNGPPKFAEDVQRQIDSPEEFELGGDDNGDGGDEMLPQALEVLRSTKRASTSMLQRRLRIGYNRAARIMEILEDRGIVGPENGSSPREILVDLDSM